MTPDTLEKALYNPDFLIRLATELKDTQAHVKHLEAKIDNDKPKVIFADAVSTSKTSILIGDLAKIIKQNGIDIGQKRLFAWLRDNGYLIKRNGSDYNMPTQCSMELGLFEVKETIISRPDGHVTVNKTPKVTGKGQQYFINKFIG
jgi:anti-repressor protein